MACRMRKYIVFTLFELTKKNIQIENPGSKIRMQAEN